VCQRERERESYGSHPDLRNQMQALQSGICSFSCKTLLGPVDHTEPAKRKHVVILAKLLNYKPNMIYIYVLIYIYYCQCAGLTEVTTGRLGALSTSI
jgi:hypothetical protein